MIQGIRDDRVLLEHQSFKNGLIRIETRGEQNGVLGLVEGRQAVLEFLVVVGRSADEPHRAESKPAFRKHSLRLSLDLGVVAESQVVVRAEIEDVRLLGFGLFYVEGGEIDYSTGK